MGTTSRQSNGSQVPDLANEHGDTLSHILVIFGTFLLNFTIFNDETAATHKLLRGLEQCLKHNSLLPLTPCLVFASDPCLPPFCREVRGMQSAQNYVMVLLCYHNMAGLNLPHLLPPSPAVIYLCISTLTSKLLFGITPEV